MVRDAYKVIVIDAVLILGLFLVLGDLAWRTSYAQSLGLKPDNVYTLFFKTFQMSGGRLLLRSPPVLDWLQVLGVLFVVVNLFYLVKFTRRRSSSHTG